MSKSLMRELWEHHMRLVTDGLVTGTQGNISCRNGQTIWIKPSGMEYTEMCVGHMVQVGMGGVPWDETLKPSTDTESHLYIYSRAPGVNAIVHTHSTFATAFAACGAPIEPYLTAIADVFGSCIPCSEYAEIGGREVGQAVVENLNQSGVVLIRNHGLFAVGDSIQQAYHRALIAEDSARTIYYAKGIGQPILLNTAQIESAYRRYSTSYGQ